mgnify:CR=1 FL=1
MSTPLNVLVWHRLFNWLGDFLTNRWLRMYGIIVLLLGIYGWGFYLPFTQGLLPGAHWPAAAYDTAFPYVGFVMLLGLVKGWWIVAISILLLLLISFLRPWRRARRVAAYLICFSVLWVTTPIALAPSFLNSYSYRHALTVESWGKTYRTAYVAFRPDDNYGEVMVSECTLRGWCHQVYRGRGNIYSGEFTKPIYDPVKDQLGVSVSPGGYVRSRDQQLCPIGSSDSSSCFHQYVD